MSIVRLPKLSVLLTVFLFAAIFLGGCRKRDKRLAAIDTGFEMNLDSTYRALTEMDTSQLSRSDLAFWYLLMNRGYYCSSGDHRWYDSLPQWAIRVLLDEKDPAVSHEIFFWEGNRFFNEGNYTESMLSLEKSERYLNNIDGSTVEEREAKTGLLYSLRAYLWFCVGEQEESLKCCDIADIHLRKISSHMHATEQIMLLKANIFDKFGQYGKSIALLDSMMDSNRDNPSFLRLCRLELLNPLKNSGDFIRLQKMVDSLDVQADTDSKLLPYKSLLALAEGDISGAKRLADLSLLKNNNKYHAFGDSLGLLRVYEEIARKEGDYRTALALGQRINESNLRSQKRMGLQNMRYAIDSYRKDMLINAEEDARNSRITVRIIIAVILLVTFLTVLLIVRNNRRKRMERDMLTQEIDSLRFNYSSQKESIRNLISCRFDTINRLCDDYFEMSDLKDDTPLRNEIFKNLKAQLTEMSGERFREELEESVNNDMDDIVRNFRAEINPTAEEVAMFTYITAGFSMKAVGIFMKLKKTSVYSRRRRLRAKIENSGAVHRQQFLDCLN